MEIESYRVLY